MSQQCKEQIYVRDTYRRVGGKRQFRVHYASQQCSRPAAPDRDYCWQHPYGSFVAPKERQRARELVSS